MNESITKVLDSRFEASTIEEALKVRTPKKNDFKFYSPNRFEVVQPTKQLFMSDELADQIIEFVNLSRNRTIRFN